MVDPDNPPRPPAERSADGSRVAPAANNFADFVRMLSDGDFDRDLTVVLQALNSGMCAAAIEQGGKAKGKLTLTFDFALEGRVFTIGSKHKVDVPEAKRAKGIMWATEDGRFTPSNPHQGNLFGVREIRDDRGFRN